MKLFVPAIISIALAIPLLSQSNMEFALSQQKGNKIVLLGELRTEGAAKWKQLMSSDEIYGYGFNLFGLWPIINPDDFDGWLRQHYGLGGRVRWAALDNETKLIASGIQTPSPEEFNQMLLAKGIKTPLRRMSDFVKENPGHLDAMADLLKEARGHALRLMPENTDKDLDDEMDSRAWGAMALETDKVFSGAWLGAEIIFFKVGEVQPERHSKLMRAVFRKHIAKVESAIMLLPTNETLWNIWAWMAQGMGDYKWEKFISGIEPVIFTTEISLTNSVPSTEAAVWLVGDARERKDWHTVIKFAKVARFELRSLGKKTTLWLPLPARDVGGWYVIQSIKDHPIKTAYVPHLEALLRLGDTDGANSVYDEMIRMEGKASAAAAAEAAGSLGMADLAKLWAKGEQVKPVPSVASSLGDPRKGVPELLLSNGHSEELMKKFRATISNPMHPEFSINTVGAFISSPPGWKTGEDRWALISGDRRILIQGTSVPDADAFSAILQRFGIKSDVELYRQYIEAHGSAPGIELLLAFRLMGDLRYDAQNANSPDNARYESLAREAAKFLNSVRLDNPDVLVYLPDWLVNLTNRAAWNLDAIKAWMSSTPKPLLSIIESLLERKPTAENLWRQWLFWNKAGELGHSVESLADRLKPSPLSDDGMLGMPISVLDEYFQECKNNGSWAKVIALLKPAWDREYAKAGGPGGVETHLYGPGAKGNLGDKVGIHLIEAYLQDGRPGEADEIFRAVMECGGKFKDISKIVELAKAKGQDRLAAQWEAANKTGK